jgi:hypothetical protein
VTPENPDKYRKRVDDDATGLVKEERRPSSSGLMFQKLDEAAAGAAPALTAIADQVLPSGVGDTGLGDYGLAQLVADELDADWKYVRAEYVSPDANLASKRAWGDMSTGGSRGIRDSQEYVRQAGASAREMLVVAAAQEWGVPASECKAEKSVITHFSGKRTTFGKVAAAASKLEIPKEPKLKDSKDWKLIGTSPARFDIPDKTTGKMNREVARYAREHGYDLREYTQRNWSKIGRNLKGKLHISVGEADGNFLNLAIYLMQDLLENTKDPYFEGSFEFGRPLKGHGWQRNDLQRSPGHELRTRWSRQSPFCLGSFYCLP